MLRSNNFIHFTGRLGQDPELKTTESNVNYTQISVAVNTFYKKEKQTIWYRCVVFGDKAKVVTDYLSKGDKVSVFGQPTQSVEEVGDRKFTHWTIIVDDIDFQYIKEGEKAKAVETNSVPNDLPF